jgi:hypothetical protein
MLNDEDTGLRRQRQHDERGCENHRYHAGNPG